MDTTHSDQPSILAFCSPDYEDVALSELGVLLRARPTERPRSGCFLLRSDMNAAECAARLDESPPIFTRQIVLDLVHMPSHGFADHAYAEHPPFESTGGAVNSTVLSIDLAGHRYNGEKLDEVTQVQTGHGSIDGGEIVRAVVRTSDRRLLSGRLSMGAGLPHAPAWPAGRPRFPFDPTLVSRSAFKLLEALALFGVRTTPRGEALDLGASPGGWTQVLLAQGLTVEAIDPGTLDPVVLTNPAVTFRALTAQEYLRTASRQFDLIVNDMRLDARESARILAAAARLLRADGSACITLKLPERAPTAILRQALAILDSTFAETWARCLYYNRHEVTVLARRPRVTDRR